MTPDEFQYLSGFLKERSGLVLTQDKTYLLESRLIPVARKRGMQGLSDLVAAMRQKRDAPLLQDVTEAMTTNESSFFRDGRPFDLLRQKLLPQLVAKRQGAKSLRIWSAACSTGQEPYTIAMCLREAGSLLAGYRIEIVATDLSNEVLEKSKSGLYSQFEVQRGLPIQMLMKYFKKAGEMWQVDPSLRAMVQFRSLNLLEGLHGLGSFDIVFIRNVLIYFDQKTKSMVLNRISELMPEDGFLFLGGAETVLGVTERFVPAPDMRGIYNLKPRGQH